MAHRSLDSMLEMFVDNTAGETYGDGRLITREEESGDVSLIAYGWLKVAAYSEERDAVTVFSGHKSLRSKTVSRWLNSVVQTANERGRSVILSGESPTVDSPNEGTQYIGNYVSMNGEHSPVEKEAIATVEESLEGVTA